MNSHESGDIVNAIHWDQKQRFKPVFDYYRGLIQLRREHPVFRLRTRDAIKKYVRLLEKDHALLAFELHGAAVHDTWNRIVVIYNASIETRTVSLSPGIWNVVTEKGQAGVDSLRTINGHQVQVQGISMTVLYSMS
ncbi:alpha-1,6-glucosidase domain-containing protein [Paenibacillus sp. JJ-100]|uniref:alpha-1,6-glucosidase domain-containing protein n=1 Tax=Paenibacillus sp. JJ-100 TaxID=2974896 RepID=UPI002FE4B435